MKKTLDIVFTSDTHGHVFPVNYAANTAEASGLLCIASQEPKGENMLVLDGGDSLQGTPMIQYYLSHKEEFDAHPVAEAFGAMGCDYFTLGNHDFNHGYDPIRDYLRAMKATCVCANVEDLRGELSFVPWTVHTLENGLRVGITGAVTEYVNVWEQKEHLSELRVNEPIAALKKALETMRPLCDVTVCIYHGGFEEDLTTGELLSQTTENLACKIARTLDFNLLLTGHQHMAVAQAVIANTHAVQPPANAARYIKIHLEEEAGKCEMHSYLESVKSAEIAESVRPVYEKLLPVEYAVQQWLDQPIGSFAKAIPAIEDKIELACHGTQLVSLFNQVQLDSSGADFSCTSLANTPAGFGERVTMRDVCSAYLFSNTLVMVEVDETVIRTALERCASYFDLADGQPVVSERFLKPKIEHYNYDFYAGLHYVFDLRKPLGQRVVELTLLDGTPLGDKKYRLIASDYRSTGTGGYEAIGKCPVVWRGTDEMPQLIADFIRKHSPVGTITNSDFEVIW